MRKVLPITISFLLLTFSMTQSAIAQKQNVITNQTTETLYVVYSTKFGADAPIPAGYRTHGWKKIPAGQQKTFWAYDPHKIYFQIWKGSDQIKPQPATQTFAFWINRNANFDVVTRQAINASITRGQLLYSSHDTSLLTHSDGFMRYNNGSRITVTDVWVDVAISEDPTVADVDPNALSISPIPKASGATINFGDPFQGNALQNPNWQWRNEPDHWDVGQTRTNFLHIEGEINRDLWASDNTHFLYQETTADAFDVETHFFAKSNTSSGVTGLVVKSPADNNWVTLKFWSRGPTAELLQYQTKQNGLEGDIWLKPTPGDTEMFFRLRKTGDTYTGWYKTHSADPWIEIGTRHFPLTPPLQLGIYTGVATNSGTFTVDYEYFKDTLSTNPGTTNNNGGQRVEVVDPNALAQKVYNKYKRTFEREDVQEVVPYVFIGLKSPDIQLLLNQQGAFVILIAADDPDILKDILPDVDDRFIDLLKNDAQIKTLIHDPDFQKLLQQPAAIDAIFTLITGGDSPAGVTPDPDVTSTEVDPNTPVNIPDPNLRAALEEALGKTQGSAITQADMETLTKLNASDRDISSIIGLELAINLTSLDLSENQILDLGPLKNLKNLTKLNLNDNKWLNLNDNQMSDISPIANLKNLITLELQNIGISDLSLQLVIANLANLEKLNLSNNPISDISPLKNLKNLWALQIASTNVSDVSPLAGLDMYRLDITFSSVSDLSPLAGKNLRITNDSPRIKKGSVDGVHIPDRALRLLIVYSLTNFTGQELVDNINHVITEADMQDVRFLTDNSTRTKRHSDPITDLTGLEYATNLEGITLYYTSHNINDLSPLVGLKKLTKLRLPGNMISDISPLAGLKNLRILKLPNNWISDISPLANLENLRELDLEKNKIVDFSPINGLVSNLTSFSREGQRVGSVGVDSNNVVNIPDPALRRVITNALGLSESSPITRADMLILTKLESDRSASGGSIQDLTGLDFATNLTELHFTSSFKYKAIVDLSPLANLKNLTRLTLRRNGVSDISPLANLKNLTILRLGQNEISDVSPLANLKNLGILELRYNEISDISPLTGLTNLKNLNLGANEISDISPLANLKNLTYLDLRSNQIQDVRPLLILPNLSDYTKRLLEDMMRNTHRCDFKMPHIHGQRLQPSTHTYTVTTKPVSPKVSAHDGEVKFAPQVGNNATLNWTYQTTVASESKHDPTTITVKFLNGKRGANGVMREIDIVEEAARSWAQHGYLRFKFLYPGQSGASDIRVKFKYDHVHEVKIEKKVVNGVEVTEYIPTGKVFDDYQNYHEDEDVGWYITTPDDSIWYTYKPPSDDHMLKSYPDFSSRLGTFANDFKNQATMKLTSDFTFGTALHEFGHALGVAHEHLSPKFKDYFKWTDAQNNYQAVYDHYQKTESWTRGDVAWNVLNTRAVATHLEGVDFDKDSIMTYGIPADLIEAQPNAPQWAKQLAANGIERNHLLSAGDKKGVSVLYPEPYPVEVDCEVSVYAKDDDISGFPVFDGDDYFDNRNNPDEFTVYHTHYSPTVKYIHKSKREYIRDEIRVEVHVTVRNFRYSDKTLELGVYALLYEGAAGKGRTTTDLEDIECKTVRIPLGGSSTVTLDRLYNRDGIWNLKWKDTSCANLYKHNELYLGDATGGGDWANVTVKLSVRSAKIIAVGLAAGAAPSRVSVQDASSVDVNGDGQVDAADLVLVSNYIGQTAPANPPVDVNGDGTVTIADLVQVAQYLGQSTTSSAPVRVVMPAGLEYTTVEGWIDQARLEDDGSLVFRQGIAKLEYLLTLIIPEKTALLPNYPNPFNPETWIPYHLAEPAHVVLTFYSVDGKVVRRLDLGHQAAGYYQSRSRAAYWDGRNAVGERVASGLYFYTLTTGDFAATRKMLIMK